MLKKLNELIIVKATSLLRYGQMVEKKKTLVWNFVILVMICVLRYHPPPPPPQLTLPQKMTNQYEFSKQWTTPFLMNLNVFQESCKLSYIVKKITPQT